MSNAKIPATISSIIIPVPDFIVPEITPLDADASSSVSITFHSEAKYTISVLLRNDTYTDVSQNVSLDVYPVHPLKLNPFGHVTILTPHEEDIILVNETITYQVCLLYTSPSPRDS